MSRVFTARIDIEGNAGTANPSVFEVFAKVVDMSMAGYSVGDAAIGDYIIDENMMTGDHNRWRITEITSIGESAYPGASVSSICAKVIWDDEGDVDPNGPSAGTGAICRSSPKGLTESPNVSVHGISEPLSIRLRNIDNRKTIDPQLGAGGGGGGTSLLKSMKNSHNEIILPGKPVSKLPSGGVVPSDSDAANGQKYIGIAAEAIAPEAFGNIYLPGNNVANALYGMGFIPGEDIFISESAGVYTNNPASFTGDNDSIIKVGVADCPAGQATGGATDLIMFTEVVVRP